MMRYFHFIEFDMVMPDQVETIRRSQEGVVGWRYRKRDHILELLFDTAIETEQERLDAIHSGQKVYVVPPSQYRAFHLPTKESILEEIADTAESLVNDVIGYGQECFNPSEYIVSADYILRLADLLNKLDEIESMGP